MKPFIILTKIVGEDEIEFLVDANKITAVQQLTDSESEKWICKNRSLYRRRWVEKGNRRGFLHSRTYARSATQFTWCSWSTV